MLSCEGRSWLLPRGFRRLGRPRKEFVEIDGSVFGSVLKAQSDLLFAEAGLQREAVHGGAAPAQRRFDIATKIAADAVEIAGDAGLVFTEGAADFGESLLLGVVKAKPLTVASIEGSQGKIESSSEQSYVARTVRVGERLAARGDGMDLRYALRAIVVIEFGESPVGANGVDMALGEDGAEPSLQGAAAVEIAEER